MDFVILKNNKVAFAIVAVFTFLSISNSGFIHIIVLKTTQGELAIEKGFWGRYREDEREI